MMVDAFLGSDKGLYMLELFREEASEFVRDYFSGSSDGSTVEAMAVIGFHAVSEELEARGK